jgi:MurNAc alpha-1-phosphate uridylyltransferase
MDAILMLHSTVEAYGYVGRGDFLVDGLGKLERRPEREVSPYLFCGLQILRPRLLDEAPGRVFSLNALYDRAILSGRLYGIVNDGEWFHIGTPDGLAQAEG